MGKIICEVCGTVYPDSADSCPICGYSRDMGGFDQGDDLFGNENGGSTQNFDASFYDDLNIDLSDFQEEPVSEPQKPQAPRHPNQYQAAQQTAASRKQSAGRQIFDYDAVNPQDQRAYPGNGYDAYQDGGNEVNLNDYPQDPYNRYDPYQNYGGYDNNSQPPKSHTGLIVFLIVLILLLIGASAFLLFKFVLPNLNPRNPVLTETVIAETTAPAPTTEPTVPCSSIVLVDGGSVELSKEGQFFLIHASVLPEDTTDVLSYQSQDENVVLVDEGGKLTAVGEGQTNVVISCGAQTTTLAVTVSYPEETTAPAETAAAETPASENAETQAAGETAAPAETQAAGETAASTEETQNDGLKDVTLKLKKTDLMSGAQGVSFRLELDCELDPTEVEWSSTDEGVATVKDGVVTTVGSGLCKINAKYGSQEVSCVIRCTFG